MNLNARSKNAHPVQSGWAFCVPRSGAHGDGASLCSASHGLLEIAGPLEDLVLKGVHAELLGTVHDVGECDDVHDESDKGDGEIDARVVHGADGEDAVILEHGEHLGEHAPRSKGVRAVLNPAALVPEEVGDGGREQQGKAAVPRMRGEAIVGVAEVPQHACVGRQL